ncbi:DUF2332 domain-containing protein [Oceanobacillus saliphilus]|uniref:DUF2332 domain-containing protein n=1 Tax=Oceanobacillus saliphilus TaxID=2925834 RepID=UPI00201D9998|nr:DUF2332 domain-containing protein [Oceanobacillus saliphilus]
MTYEKQSKIFRRFAEVECKDSSPLYEYLSLKIAKDDWLLELSSHAHMGQPVPNLLYGAVHYLLLKGKNHTLKQFYPSITGDEEAPEDSFPHFKRFCKSYETEIISILKTKNVQTNEVRRCAYLYPVFCYVFRKTKKPLSFIEIGTSAGLQLLWDRFSYSYGNEKIYGSKDARLHIQTQVKNGTLTLIDKIPPVKARVGVDLHICDLRNEEDYLWLKALIWPEHTERFAIFEQAVKEYKKNPPKLVEGDGVKLLPSLAEQIPENHTLCIFHTHVANQLPKEVKEELLEEINKIGRNRNVYHIYNNIWDGKLHLDYFMDGTFYENTIGETDAHGRWFEWNLV